MLAGCLLNHVCRTHLGQTPPDGTGLLWSEVEGSVLLLLVQLAEVLPCLLVHHSQDTGNGFADRVTSIEQGKLLSSMQVDYNTHILVSLAALPPAIFCTRRVRSSFLSSTSCFDKSFFDLCDT